MRTVWSPARLWMMALWMMAGMEPGLAAQDAKALRAQANAESNQERVVQLLCKAADAEPKNKEYRKDCDVGRAALVSSDKTMLKTAQDASDAGKIATAKRYAKYVSSLDPELHKQAEQLLAKLNAADTPSTGGTTTVPSTGPSQSVVLAQALAAYDSGNLQVARAGAQSITDASLKPAASRLLTEIERYTGLVSAGQRHEQAKEYSEAERAYQSALELNTHVASDDLSGRTQRMRQMAAAAPGQTGTTVASNHSLKGDPGIQVKPGKLPSDFSPDEKKRWLLAESAAAMNRNDFDGAGRYFRQVLATDPVNAEAKQGLKQISSVLNRDPARLEKTLREAIVAFYGSHFEDAESRFNRYLGADSAKKKGAAYFYLGATEATLALLEDASRRESRSRQARDDFKQARLAGYKPVERYVSARVLAIWSRSGS